VLLAGGDMLSGTLDSNEFRGRPTIEMMNTMGFVADVAWATMLLIMMVK
jgi:2',3'-cyclic-nucleotide 2'-phosphodiesterase (5'-nucleotidase family)